MPKPILSAGTASLVSRRHFIKYTALTAAAFGTAPAFLRGQNLHNQIQIAVVGAGGKGESDTDHAAFALNNMIYWLKRDGAR